MEQQFSHYPAWPVPVRVRLAMLDEHACSYLSDRTAQMRGLWVESISPEAMEAMLDAGFRRSGKIVYQPVCRGCRACIPIRIGVNVFKITKSQKRIWSKNSDLLVTISSPVLTDEKILLYRKYLQGQHRRMEDTSYEDLGSFLYNSPCDSTVELEYRTTQGRLIGVGICDVLSSVVSSVYFFWDPDEKWRSLGIYGFLKEMEMAKSLGIAWYHLGYWVKDSPTMDYKSTLSNFEVLSSDGLWRRADRRKLEKYGNAADLP